MTPYPIFLIGLENRHCIVVGGSAEAEGKVMGLLAVNATLTVISPTLTSGLLTLAEDGRFLWLQRSYRPGDLHGAFLVIAERHDPATNALIHAEAEAERALVNVMDDVEHCNFVAGSVIRQGALTISISTSGAAPAYSVRLRQRLQQEFGPEHDLFLQLLQSLRAAMARVYPDFQQRRRLWYELVDSELLSLIKAADWAAVESCLTRIVGCDVVMQHRNEAAEARLAHAEIDNNLLLESYA